MGALTARAMWKKLEQLHLKKSLENIFTLQGSFFNYRLTASDDIGSHIQTITKMVNVLADLRNPIPNNMLISKIICNLPPSYNSIVAAWSNVPEEKQTVDYLEEQLTRHEGLMQIHGLQEDFVDQAFFTRAHPSSSKSLSRKEHHIKDVNYLKDLKAQTKCYNCGEYNHWAADCTKPKKSNQMESRIPIRLT